MAYLQLDAMNISKVATDLSVAYVDHNTLQQGFENADDHEFIKSAARKYGIVYSKPGNGICHQVHLESFGKPGTILLGSDSHTPTGGGLGAIAIGAGGLDVAVAMATGKYSFPKPKVMGIELRGRRKGNVSAKDVSLYVLSVLGVKGGVGYILEYFGEGVADLDVTERATITNMGAETGATTSIFPSDERTLEFLKMQGRENDYVELRADDGAKYDKNLVIDLESLSPMIAKPHSPGNVVKLKEVEGIKVDQVAIGSCTNSSFLDLMKVAKILKGKKVHPNVSLVIAPGSSTVLRELAENGALSELIKAGARILESACGPCIGMGQAPKSDGISLRTFNRNFKGRCGTITADVYLCSPETAAISAIEGKISEWTYENLNIEFPKTFDKNENYIIRPEKDGKNVKLEMGPNIKPVPKGQLLSKDIEGKVLLKVGDDITTDDIMPSHAGLLPYRSNIPKLSEYAFGTLVGDFKERADSNGGGIVVGGENYGQGSSREHAAIVPLYLGVKAVIAKSFARIHVQNLINFGILPLRFEKKEDYDLINENDALKIENMNLSKMPEYIELIVNGTNKIKLFIEGNGKDFEVLKAGGKLSMVKEGLKNA
jgi:aconitate hydratase